MNDDNKLYRLVFTGNVLPGHSRKKVVSRLQQMLHLERDKASRLVAGKHKQINKKLTLDRAEKLRLLILKQGAECVLLPIEESFVSTQQLPMFIRNQDEGIQKQNDALNKRSSEDQTTAGQEDTQDPISRFNPNSITLSRTTKLKYLFYVIFFMIVEAIVIWNIKPAPVVLDCTQVQKENTSVSVKASSLTKQLNRVKPLSPAVTKTTEKLRNISVRAALWFAEQGSDSNPVNTSWIWIQGDIGISVREMNDSWGNTIRYSGKKDRFELRSSGPDNVFYTDDDIFREMII